MTPRVPAADLEAIRELGFNSVRVPLEWAASEPARGTYDFAALNETLALAGQHGLQVSVRLDVSPLPGWLLRRHPDGRFVPESKSGTAGTRPRLPGPSRRARRRRSLCGRRDRQRRTPRSVARDRLRQRSSRWLLPLSAYRAPLSRMADGGVRTRAATVFSRSSRSRRVCRPPASGPSRAPHRCGIGPRRAVGEQFGQGAVDPPESLRRTARSGRLAHVNRRRSRTAQRFRPRLAARALLVASRLALALDGLRSASRDKGWLMTDALPAARASDLRLMTWAALSRGARGVTFGEWRGSSAGALARVIGRNQALFGPLRPRAGENRDRLRSPIAGPGVCARSPTSIACSSSGTSRSISSISTKSPAASRAAIRWCSPTRSRLCPRPLATR